MMVSQNLQCVWDFPLSACKLQNSGEFDSFKRVINFVWFDRYIFDRNCMSTDILRLRSVTEIGDLCMEIIYLCMEIIYFQHR